MKKLLLSTCLAVSILCSAVACAYVAPEEQSASQTAVNSGSEIMPMGTRIPGKNIYEDSKGYWEESTSTVAGQGKIFRIWFQNNAEQAAQVHVYRVTKLGKKEVINYKVNSHQGAWREYSYSDRSVVTYQVFIEARSGTVVKGYVAATQINTSLA